MLSLDQLDDLEGRILRALELIADLRDDNARLEQMNRNVEAERDQMQGENESLRQMHHGLQEELKNKEDEIQAIKGKLEQTDKEINEIRAKEQYLQERINTILTQLESVPKLPSSSTKKSKGAQALSTEKSEFEEFTPPNISMTQSKTTEKNTLEMEEANDKKKDTKSEAFGRKQGSGESATAIVGVAHFATVESGKDFEKIKIQQEADTQKSLMEKMEKMGKRETDDSHRRIQTEDQSVIVLETKAYDPTKKIEEDHFTQKRSDRKERQEVDTSGMNGALDDEKSEDSSQNASTTDATTTRDSNVHKEEGDDSVDMMQGLGETSMDVLENKEDHSDQETDVDADSSHQDFFDLNEDEEDDFILSQDD